jgi:uncharacterized membrane protein
MSGQDPHLKGADEMKTTQNRLISKAAWVSVVALVLLVGNAFSLWDKIGITGDAAQAILNAALAVLTAFGIFNDPTNKTGY